MKTSVLVAVVSAALSLSASFALAQTPDVARPAAAPPNPAIVRMVSGELDCTSLSKGVPCGRELWTLTIQPDGSRTMRAFFNGSRDGQQINTIYRSDASFHFIEAFSNAWDKGKPLGSGYYVADGDRLQVTTMGTAGFRSEQLPLPEKYSVLLHPPSLDGWHFGMYDASAGGPQPMPTFIFGGAGGGPRVAAFPIVLEFVGRETIKVPAGTFATEHYRFGKDTDVWTTGPDRIMVRHEYRVGDTRFELARIEGPVRGR